ncbi:hypothetical protein IFM89_026082 [Coptis chinensis]|uniref:F-box domain-containing protein n=1 Tax=Coptis chinensis TaxID=261450 RepID=A0A835HFM4_9MAGN|nr:hypothetical protein IFM89_026082 [Coptis chinensis]
MKKIELVQQMANLPHEIIIEILTRLPAKSLLKFRCVCKSWRTLTYDPTFTKMHFARTLGSHDVSILATTVNHFYKEFEMIEVDDEENEILSGLGFRKYSKTHIYCVDGSSGFEVQFKIKDPFVESYYYEDLEIVGSCNGIVCLVKSNDVCLLNPYTREYKIVNFEHQFNFNLEHTYGLGYDPTSSDDFKLVHFDCSPESISQVSVYSLNDASCVNVSNVPYQILELKESGVVFLNGALHWIARRTSEGCEILISFNIEEKIIREFSRPVGVNEFAFMSVGLLGGELCLLCKTYDTDIDIWVLKNYSLSDSWVKLFTIGETVMISVKNSWPTSVGYNEPNPRPLCFCKNGEVLLRDSDRIVVYDPKDKTSRDLKVHFISHCSRMAIMIHFASLVPLNSGTYVETVVGVEEEEPDMNPALECFLGHPSRRYCFHWGLGDFVSLLNLYKLTLPHESAQSSIKVHVVLSQVSV